MGLVEKFIVNIDVINNLSNYGSKELPKMYSTKRVSRGENLSIFFARVKIARRNVAMATLELNFN
jgi:hypothetical protein